MYFYGNSQGGHEALTVIQRWPKDYDGAVAIHPAYDFTALQLSGLHLGQALYRTPGSWLSGKKLATLATAVMARCDQLDGVRDGIIANVAGCRKSFDLVSLRCRGGTDTGDSCLSDDQLQTVQTFVAPTTYSFTLQGDVRGFSGWPVTEGAFSEDRLIFGLGTSPTPAKPPSMKTDAFVYFMADQMIRYFVMRDPNYDSLHFDPAEHVEALQRVSRLIDSSDPDLDTFRGRGGKLLLLHGTVDMAIPPGNTVVYYDQLKNRYGDAQLQTFVRFYLLPGFGHGNGSFQLRWEGLTALDNWVETNRPPTHLIATDGAPETAGRTRPLCDYPSWAKYDGSGAINLAASFSCAMD
jgi:feruloyl esterase